MVTYRKAVDSFMDSTPCCTSMAEFRYEPLPSEEPVTFRLDENSDSFVFQSGKSYFKAFQLPEKEVPYHIQVKSFALGETIDKAHIFYPQVALLDGGFTVLKQSAPEDFVVKKAGLKETASISWGLLRLKLEGTIFVDMPNAKYLVVYTTKELMGTRTSEHMSKQIQPIPVPIPGGVLIGAVPAGVLPVDIPHSPFGWLSITIENQI
ncbi:MAG: MalM family protein [Nitrospiria bacterium]